MSTSTTLRRMAALAAGGALVLAGCGGDSSSSSSSSSSSPTRTVDDATIESQIDQQLSTSQAEVTKAQCPSDEPSKTGNTFECSVTWSNGATGKVKVTQQSATQFTYTPVDGSVQIPGTAVATEIEQQLAKQGAPNAQVTCPSTVIVKVDSPVTCDVSGASGAATGQVTFTFSTAEGTVDPSSVSTS